MKIPKSLKLPRKLKKEVKKGITRRAYNSPPCDGHTLFFTTISYYGSNTKAFRRLCKYARRQELNSVLRTCQMYKDELTTLDWDENL